MRDKHQFLATETMYKKRFNSDPRSATELIASDMGKVKPHARTGWLRSAQRDLVGSAAPLESRAQSQISARASPPISCQERSSGASTSALFPRAYPGYLRPAEKWMVLSRNYVAAALEMGLWKPLPGGAVNTDDKLAAWFNRTRSCSIALALGDSRHAFRMLGMCMDEYQDFVTLQNPLLIVFILHSLVPAATLHPEVAMCSLRYMRDVSRIFHKNSHPIRLILEHLYEMGLQELEQNTGELLEPYFGLLCNALGPQIEHFAEMFIAVTRGFHAREPGELAMVEQAIPEAIHQLEPLPDTLDFEFFGMRLVLVWNLMRRGILPRAQRLNNGILESPVAARYPSIMGLSHELACHISCLSGDHQQVLATAKRRIKFCVENYGLASYVTIDALSYFESYLRNTGDACAADRALRGLDVATRSLNKQRKAAKDHMQKR
ncbi:hypothetical protein DL771_012331 [Monosporascus sp. 5C6A]|nr:hypothetical protein DL771_012331 [Monosporascus sp. 5C6A]